MSEYGTNFNSYQPPQGLQPSAVSGVEGGLEWIARQQAQQQALQQMGIQTQQRGAELNRFQGMTPGMVQVQNLAGAQAQAQNNPQMINQFALGQQGQAQSLQAKGREDMGTVGGKIEKTNSGNLISTLESTARAFELAAASGTLGAQEGYDQWRKTISPTMQQYFPASYTPDVPERMRKLQRAIEESPEHRRTMELNDQRFQQDVQVQFGREQIQQSGATDRANIAADATRYGADQSRGRVQETPQKAVARLRTHLARNPEDIDSLEEYQSHLEDQWDKFTQRDPALMLMKVRAMSNEDPKIQQQAAAEYNRARKQFFSEKGIYIGKQPQINSVRQHPTLGSIRWVPGWNRDPSNPEHWQRVDSNPRNAR
jgi:hypothetical protein